MRTAMVTQQYTGLLAYYNQSYSIPNLKILSPPLELGLIKTKKEHSVSVVVFLMVGEGGQKYSELHLLLPLMSAPLLFHP